MTTVYSSAPVPCGDEAASNFPASLRGFHANVGSKGPISFQNIYLAEQDDKFIRYDVSPGASSSSSGSDDGHDTYFAFEDELMHEPPLQFPDSSSLYPVVSDKLDPFDTLPISLTRFQEHLISSHIHDNLQTITGFKNAHFGNLPSIPDPSFHMITSAGFRITLARSALDRLSTGKYQGETVRKSLESAAFRHKTDAIATVQVLSKTDRPSYQTEELLESLIGLEKLEKKVATSIVPSPHLVQLREVLRSSGGPMNIQSSRLSRMMVHFECLYGTGRQSYVWSEVDFLQSLGNINGFLSSTWTTWCSMTQKFLLIADEMKNILGADTRPISSPSFLKDGSVLRSCLSRTADGTHGIDENDRLDLICQLTSLFMLCSLVLEQQNDPVQIQQHIDQIHETVESAQLGNIPNERIMWLLQNGHFEGHAQRIWDAAEYVWLLKHVNHNVQCMIKEWLLKFLTGRHLGRCFKLDAFYFSYAS